MKTSVNQNETPFDRMKRQAFEWLEKKPTAPAIIYLALSELKSIPTSEIAEEILVKKEQEEITSLLKQLDEATKYIKALEERTF